MWTRRAMVFAALAIVSGLSTTPARAQLGGPSSRIEVAEVRGLGSVGDVDAYADATVGSEFAASVKTVLVRFQSAKPPSDTALVVTWTKMPDSGAPLSIRRTPVVGANLVDGFVDALTNGGAALARGRYVVSLMGSDDHLYRSVEFRVGPRPSLASGRSNDTTLVPYTFEGFSFVYPDSYGPQPVVIGMKGVSLRKTAPFGLMFVALSDPGIDSVQSQGREIAQLILGRLEAVAPQPMSPDVNAIPANQLGPGIVAGVTIDVPLRRGLAAHVKMISKDVDGRRILFGFATITGEDVPADYANLVTDDPMAVAEEFGRMVASFQRRTK